MGCRGRKFAHTFHPAFGELVAAGVAIVGHQLSSDFDWPTLVTI